MKRKTSIWICAAALMAALVFTAACGQEQNKTEAADAEEAAATVGNLTPAEAQAMILENRDNPDFVLLDIRRPEEFASGHLEGAGLLDFYSPEFKDELAKLDRDKTYLIYCRTGRRTELALGMMQELGFKKAYHMTGGITRWKAEGLPSVK